MATRRAWQGGGREFDDFEEEEEDSEMTSREAASGDGRSSGRNFSARNPPSSDYRNKSSVGPPPQFDGDRSAGAWEEYRVRARLWLSTTTIEERSRGPRMLQALSGRAFEAMKHLADDDSWMNSLNNGQQLLDEMSKPTYFGKEEVESLWSSLQKLFYTKLRKDDDDLVTFRTKFEEATRKVQKHKVELPSPALGFLYLKQLRVDEGTFERIITITDGYLSLEKIMTAVRKLKMRLGEETEDKKKTSGLWMNEPIAEEGESQDGVPHEDMDDEETEILEGALQELQEDGMFVSEEEAKEVLLTVMKNKFTHQPVNKMSYKQIQMTKNAARNSRGFHMGSNSGANAGQKISRKDISQLKSITKCRNCDEVGHWHRECPHPKRSSGSSSSGGAGSSKPNYWSVVKALDQFDDEAWEQEIPAMMAEPINAWTMQECVGETEE